jgi:hypothetical protein
MEKNLNNADAKINVNEQELTEEEKKQQKIKEENEKTRDEAKKARRPSQVRMAEDIRRMVKKAASTDEPTEAKYARALLGIFLKELAAQRRGKHVEVAERILSDIKAKRPVQLKQDGAMTLANAAIRYEITFGRVAMR